MVDKGDSSIELAIELTQHTLRVIFATSLKEISANSDLKTKIKQSNVKILYESEILEIKGLKTAEKVIIHDLNEDEEYELFMDAVVILL